MAKQAAKKKSKGSAKAKASPRGARRTSRKTSSKKAVDLIISKTRTKAASGINVSGEFYAALDASVRNMIATAEERATQNGRRTLRPHDL